MVDKFTKAPSGEELVEKINDIIDDKQDTLVSGTNIKTINNTSLLGSGNIDIQGGSTVTVDSALSATSTNPVQNKVITTELNKKIEGISSSDVTTALGYTPYNATNPNGYTSNVGTITGIKMNGSSKGTSGVVDLGTVITAHQDISGKQDKITSTNKLSADLLSEGTTNKLVSSTEKTTWNGKQDALSSTQIANIAKGGTAVQPGDLATVATSGSYNDLSDKPTIPSEVTESTVSGWGFTKNTGTVTKVNNVSPVNGNVTLSIPTTASDVNALPSSTKYGATIDVTLSTTDYKQTITLKDQDGNTLNSKTVDFPVESMVVSGTFDSTNKKIVLTLQNGNTTDIPVGDLISGLQTEITSTNKLSADLISDGTTNKTVTASEKSTWNNKQNAISDLATIRSGAGLGATSLQPNDDISELNNDAGYITNSAISNLANKDLSNLSSTGNAKFQTPLVSGTNIKTINNNSILGSGNLTLDGLPSQTGKAGKFLQTDGTDASWESAPFRNIGEIVASTIPLTDAGLHLLDGSLIQGDGIYSAFVDYIAGLYETDPTANYFAQADGLSWTQPTLSADGTLGGDSFAVYSSYTENGHPAYYLFDNNSSTYYSSYNASSSNYEIFYNPVPLKVSQITIYYHNSSGNNKNMTLYASNDNSSWVDLTAVSSESGDYKTYTLQNENYYKYYKMEYSSWTAIWNIDITATQQTSSPEQWWQDQITQYGVCGKFVYNSTNNTVRLPKITGIVEGTTDLTALGDLVEAGLPNITGTFNATGLDWASNGTSGAFHFDTSGGNNGVVSGSTGNKLAGFDASLSSSIYGNSSTVQPQTIKAFYYIVIATSTKTDIQVDIDEIATDLNGKVDTADLAEVQCVVETYVNGTSWYRVYSDGWCEQGGWVNSGVTSVNSGVVVTFLKPYKDTNYTIVMGSSHADTSNNNIGVNYGNLYYGCYYAGSKSTTSIRLTMQGTWQASGYIEV